MTNTSDVLSFANTFEPDKFVSNLFKRLDFVAEGNFTSSSRIDSNPSEKKN